MALAARAGFSHVSDDDYARTVIAQQFAHAPRVDPSGTSWLPLPFWLSGASMMVLGRSLAAARACAWAFDALGSLAPFFALRHLQITTKWAAIAAFISAAAPWSVWLASATVPDGWAAALTAAALLLTASQAPRGLVAAASIALAGSLCRYEVWPACAFVSIVALARAWSSRTDRAVLVASALIAAIGPASWMLWNAHAHGDPMHFFARVSAFRQASGDAPRTVLARVAQYPAALVTAFPEAALGAAFCLVSSDRKRFALPLAGALAIVCFLVWGDLKDGAPTHHPERALGAVAIVATCAGVVVASRAGGALNWLVTGPAVAALVALAVLRFRDPPGAGAAEDRAPQIALGLSLRSAGSLTVTPCNYEHFALIAALSAPERVSIAPPSRPRVDATCPRVERW